MEFQRLELLIGDKINVLKQKTVLVIGLGGVGGYATESLARSAIGHLILIDYDKVDITNINRQIIATHQTIGRKKVDCFRERIQDINPNCQVDTFDFFYDESQNDLVFQEKIDFIVDCCDSLESKKSLIIEATKRKIPIISCMGTGNKFHPELFEITKLKNTSYDPLAKKLRYLLKDNKECLDTKVLYSKEIPVKVCEKIGSTAYVPSVAGLILTSYVINRFIEGED